MNAFDAFAEAVKPSWARTRERAQAKAAQTRAKTAAEKALAEEDALERQWAVGERRRRRELLDGPHGRDVRGLQAFLRTLTPSSAPALVRFVERAAWIRDLDNATKLQVLRIVDERIGVLVKGEGYAYPDDAMPGEEPRAYQVVRGLMEVR